MNRAFLVLWFVGYLPELLLATDYYVSPRGNDNNPGTINQPWLTVHRVNTQVLLPGDSVNFEGGQRFTGTLLLDAEDSGNGSANPVRIRSYGLGQATLDSGSGAGLSAYNSAGFEISNLLFQGSGSATNTTDGLAFWMDLLGTKLEHISLTQVEVTGFGGTGMYFGANAPDHSGYRDVVVSNTTIHDNGGDGMFTWGTYTTGAGEPYSHESFSIRYCEFYRNLGTPGANSGSGVYLKDIDGALIEYCEAFENGSRGGGINTGGPVGIWVLQAKNVTIQHNESHHNSTSYRDGGGFDFDGGVESSTMQYNYSHDNYGAGYLLVNGPWARPFLNNTIRYNISENDSIRNEGAITLDASPGGLIQNTAIYNNSIFLGVGGGSAVKQIGAGAIDVVFYNNIFMTRDGRRLLDVPETAGLTFQGNDYWSSAAPFTISWGGVTYSNLNAWRSGTGQERLNGAPVGFQLTPLLVAESNGQTIGEPSNLSNLAAYRLRQGSQLINQGLDLEALFGISLGSQDFYGYSLTPGRILDIGANERPSGANEPPVLTASPAWGPLVENVDYVVTLSDPNGLEDLRFFGIDIFFLGRWINLFPASPGVFIFDYDRFGNYRLTLAGLDDLIRSLGPMAFRARLVDRGPLTDQKFSWYY